MARPTRTCPFLNGDCIKSDCRLWVTYIPKSGEDTIGECTIYLHAVTALPSFGAALEPDED